MSAAFIQQLRTNASQAASLALTVQKCWPDDELLHRHFLDLSEFYSREARRHEAALERRTVLTLVTRKGA